VRFEMVHRKVFLWIPSSERTAGKPDKTPKKWAIFGCFSDVIVALAADAAL
jgi:hypothetical protein